jgi:hypothetical protein
MKVRHTCKRCAALLLAVIIAAALIPAGRADASDASVFSSAEITVNGSPVPYGGYAVLPDPGRLHRPALAVRPVAEAAGFTVTGSRSGASLRAADGEINLWADRDYFIRVHPNGSASRHEPAGAPFSYAGRLYMNADALADMLGLVFIETVNIDGEGVYRFVQPSEAVEGRYRHNAALFDLFLEQGGGFIYGQSREPVRAMQIGSRGNGSGHGCGPSAVYNVLHYLGDEASTPASVIRFLDYNGGINLNGLAGTNPEVLTQYIRRAGYAPRIQYLPAALDEGIRDAGVSILLYGRMRGGFFVHYAMIRYDGERFHVYNEFGSDTRPRVYDSIDALVTERGYRTVALITVH